jgi:hypothetical protein
MIWGRSFGLSSSVFRPWTTLTNLATQRSSPMSTKTPQRYRTPSCAGSGVSGWLCSLIPCSLSMSFAEPVAIGWHATWQILTNPL